MLHPMRPSQRPTKTFVLRRIDVSIAYAVWAGTGTAVIALVEREMARDDDLGELIGSHRRERDRHKAHPLHRACAERPLRVVVCPASEHPRAAERVRELYDRIGCEVIEQTPEAVQWLAVDAEVGAVLALRAG